MPDLTRMSGTSAPRITADTAPDYYALYHAARVFLWNMPAPRSRSRFAEWDTLRMALARLDQAK